MNTGILHEIHDEREAGLDQLCAGKRVLGWFLYGNNCTVDIEDAVIKHIRFLTSRTVDFSVGCRIKPEFAFHKVDSCLVCSYSGDCQDCEGTGNRWNKPDHREAWLNDDLAQAISDYTCTRVDGHYQIELLWASEDSEVPENYEIAKARLVV